MRNSNVVKIVACLILGICAQIPATSQTADSTLDRADARVIPSGLLGPFDDQDHYAIPGRPVLRHHLMLPASAPANLGQPRIKPKLRAAVEPRPNAVNTGGGIVYVCDSNVPTSTCTYLNTTVAGYYNNIFTNANANIYIKFGTTGLGGSTGYINLVHYTPYVTDLTNKAVKSSNQASAISAITTYAAPAYGTQNIVGISVALGTAYGFTGLLGINAAETASCTPYTSGCYNEVITVANAASQASGGFTLYYDDQGGTEAANQYDFYAVVQHETDEVLGTSSCISTQNSSGLSDDCDGPVSGSNGIPSVVDLLRYSSPATLALDTTPSTTAGQYYSFDGGVHYGVGGDGNDPKVYNTLDNGDDFADYISSSPDCGTNQAVQDAEGCPGEDAGLTILNDGQSEITILNTDGFDIPEAAISSPTPGSTLSGSSATFTWSAVSGASDYWVYVGTTGIGSSDVFANSSAITATSQAVTGLPTSGKIYVRVYSYVGGFWTSTDFTYTGGTAGSGLTITRSPTSLTFASTTVGSTTAAQLVTIKNTGTGTVNLTSETITGGQATSFIKSATTCGASLAAAASCTVSVEFKPATTGTLSSTLSIADNATGSPQTVTLMGTGASSGGNTAAALTSPMPGSTLAGGPVTFTWSAGTGATGYALWIGSTGAGSDNLYYSGEKASTVTSLAVSGLPVNGETIYVRLITYYASSSTFASYTYTSATGAVLKTPAPGSTLTGSGVTFSWTAGVGATGYALWIGNSATDADNLYYSGEKASTVTSLAVSGLPTNGETLYVRLITYYGSSSSYINYTYKAAAGAALTTPTPGSTLAGSSVTFSWTAGVNATGYALWIGNSPTNADNLYYSGEKAPTVTSLTVNGLPTNGETIYVRLITYYGSSSAYINYTYTAAPAVSTLSITSTAFNPSTATVGTGYSAQQAMAATGGTTPYSWSVSGQPNGMSMNASTGALYGTPTVSGPFNITVTVQDSGNPQQTASKLLTLTVQ
jgi:hypothetical protein